MKVLILGGGGREHALAWKLAQSPTVTGISSAPGNAGLAELGEVHADLRLDDVEAVVEVAKGSDLVVVGPEEPLAAGVVDRLEELGVPAFGPSAAAARLEASKSYAKEVMGRVGVPTAPARIFTSSDAALDHLAGSDGPYVVKADGLAAGKGVLVTDDRKEAAAWVDRCFQGAFGSAGYQVIIEDYLEGPELSIIVLCDGRDVEPLAPARDYKRRDVGDGGPNTGGMGAFSPVRDLEPGLVDRVVERVVIPVIQQMAAEGVTYRGALYAGLVLTTDGPRVLEFNCRLGDPETQVILPRIEGDLAGILLACAQGELARHRPTWARTAAVDVVLTAQGYPGTPRTGDVIAGFEEAARQPGVVLFHAGTSRGPAGTLTSGGRVLNVVGTGPDLATARSRSYEAVQLIHFEGKQYRTDIAEEAA